MAEQCQENWNEFDLLLQVRIFINNRCLRVFPLGLSKQDGVTLDCKPYLILLFGFILFLSHFWNSLQIKEKTTVRYCYIKLIWPSFKSSQIDFNFYNDKTTFSWLKMKFPKKIQGPIIHYTQKNSQTLHAN